MPEEKAFKPNVILLSKMRFPSCGATVNTALRRHQVLCNKNSERSLTVRIHVKCQWKKRDKTWATVFNLIPQTYGQSYTERVCADPPEQHSFGEEDTDYMRVNLTCQLIFLFLLVYIMVFFWHGADVLDSLTSASPSVNRGQAILAHFDKPHNKASPLLS